MRHDGAVQLLAERRALACRRDQLAGWLVDYGLARPNGSFDTFELTAPESERPAARRTRTQILIAEPSALKALDGEKIVIKPSAKEVQFLAGAQWSDRLPRVVQARLADTFQRSGLFGGVGKPGEGLAIDYQIITEIRAFDVRLDGGDRADIEIHVRILNDRNGVVRAQRTFTATSPLSGAQNAAYTAALDRAFATVATDIVNWTASQI